MSAADRTRRDSPLRPGPQEGRIEEMLRVDHAGEYGAVAIYRGQNAVFSRLPHKQDVAAQIAEMEAGEAHHLSTFDELLAKRGIRPSLLAPLWNAAGFGLGAASALMGEKSAMALTEAVEDVIEQHYAEQEQALKDSEPALADMVRQFREDELEHKHTAEDSGAQDAPGYQIVSAVIRAGCRAAIKIAEKV